MYYTYDEKPNTVVSETPPIAIETGTSNTIHTEATKEIETNNTTNNDDATDTSIFKGKAEIYTETDSESGHKATVYRFENGFELAINEKATLTFDEVRDHILSLPEPLRNNPNLRRLNIKDFQTDVGGNYLDAEKRINIYWAPDKIHQLNTLTHELAHAFDANEKIGSNYHLSVVEVYEKIFKADNKEHVYVNERTGRRKTPKLFVTDYARRNYIKYKKQFKERFNLIKDSKNLKITPANKMFIEDFADSTKHYLNPKLHQAFVEKFPHRAEYLKKLYGEPVFDENAPLARFIREAEIAENENELRETRFQELTDDEFRVELEKVLGDTKKVEAYYKMESELKRLNSVQDAIAFHDTVPERVKVLTEAGWDKTIAEDIAKNPNSYLSKVNKKKRQYRSVLEQTRNLVKENLDLSSNKPIPTPTTKPTKEKPKKEPKKATTTTKTKQTNKEKKQKEEPKKTKKQDTTPTVNPKERGKVKNITYTDYIAGEYRGAKTITYNDGTEIKFRKHGDPDYPGQTLEAITIDGKTIQYLDNTNVHKHFQYQDKQLSPEDLRFADEFIDRYGTYAGKAFNNHERGRITPEDLREVEDDEAFKWLQENKDRYNEILEKSEITQDIVTMRIQAKNYLKPGEKTIKDKGYTSSSAGATRTNLIDLFGNARDIDSNWTFITITPKGTKGARFQGNSVARNYGDIDDDFEMEITYKQNMEFTVVLMDEQNKIVILKPQGE